MRSAEEMANDSRGLVCDPWRESGEFCYKDERCSCRAAVQLAQAVQREAIEAAAKVADEIDKGIYKPGTIATAIRALLPPAPPSREESL